MVTDEMYAEMLKVFALQILALQEDCSALALLLKNRGVTDGELFFARKTFQDVNRTRRERIEKLDPTMLRDFLKGFEGPVQ